MQSSSYVLIIKNLTAEVGESTERSKRSAIRYTTRSFVVYKNPLFVMNSLRGRVDLMYSDVWLQLILILVVLTVITKPLGLYLFNVLSPQGKTPLDKILKPLEKLTYRLCRIEPLKEQTWKRYLLSLLVFNGVIFLFSLLLLSIQSLPFLNPQKLPSLPLLKNIHIVSSFLTNTGMQCYNDTDLSYLSKMGPLTLLSFLSAAIGLSVAAALMRALTRYGSKTLGNYWTDLIRISYYLLLPLALVVSLIFMAQGVPQNFSPPTVVQTLERGSPQTLIQGPIASLDAIKIISTTGGGYTSANAAHPFENPTPFTNALQTLLLLLIPAAQTYAFGKKVKNQNHGWWIYVAMAALFSVSALMTSHFESEGLPIMHEALGDPTSGNFEGKEMRIGVSGSTLFTCATTATCNGGTNSSLTSYSPLSILSPLLNLQLGEVIFGGVGSGLYSMLLFVIFTIFIVGLMIGRTPDYLGNRLSDLDIKLTLFALFFSIVSALGFTALACTSSWGLAPVQHTGAHGFTEILYTFCSAAVNNGSLLSTPALASPGYQLTTALSMLLGRFFVIIPVLALAGSFVAKKKIPLGPQSFPVSNLTFTLLLILSILLIGALSFLPSLFLGPLLEHFDMIAGRLS